MHRSLAAFLVLLPACYKYQPPPPAEPRNATPVNASMGETWDAVIDLFATRNIPIRTIERASGIIATEGLRVEPEDGAKWADCGQYGNSHYRPTTGIYNVLVRGDSTRSTVRTTVRWSYITLKVNLDCTSSYVWEHGLEQDVKTRAEAEHHRNPRHAAEPAMVTRPGSNVPGASAQSIARDVPPGSQAASSSSGGIRTNDQLMESVTFRSAVDDVLRLEIITGVRELRPDTLTVDLGDGAFTSASTEYNLGRLYLAYRGTTDYSAEGALELQHDGRRVGWYVPGKLTWEAVR
jgi:hypothetical protein